MRGYKTNKRYTAPLAAAMAALLALSGCGSLTNRETEVETVSQAIEVHTTTAGYGTIDRQTQFVGRVEAAESVKVYATTSAKVIEANAAPGERVEKGQLLFALDTEMLEIAAETSRLQYEAAISGADMTISSAQRAYKNARDSYADMWETQDELDSERGNARANLNRVEAERKAAQEAVVRQEAYIKELTASGGKWNPDSDPTFQEMLQRQQKLADVCQETDDDMNAIKEELKNYQPDEDEYKNLLQQQSALALKYGDQKKEYDDYSEQVENYRNSHSSGQAAIDEAREKLATLTAAAAYAEQAYQIAYTTYQQADNAYDTFGDQVDTVRDNVSALRDTYRNTAGDEEAGIVGTAQSQVDLAKISYDNAVKNLNDARVYAPVSGIVSAKNVSASDFASPGVPLYVIEPEGDAPMVSFNLSEDGANALGVGSPVTVIYNGVQYPAVITELANTANPQTGLYAAKAQTDQPLPTSRSGGVVKVQASTAKAENALLLSLDLLEYDGNQPYVYVYRGGVAARVDVVTGISSADDIVILSGLTEDDQIITTWHPDLKDGAAVTLAE